MSNQKNSNSNNKNAKNSSTSPYSLYGVYNDLFNRNTSKPQKDLLEHTKKKTENDLTELKDLFDELEENLERDNLKSTKTTEKKNSHEVEITKTKEEVKEEINQLIGLDNIKADIDALMDFIKVQQLRKNNGLPNSGISLHTAFIGNPGTGKTTIARLLGEYFKTLGILKKGHLVEVSRVDLVAEHVGGTAIKTNKVIDSALDGILFIDEAYSLSTGAQNDYGKEAINILVDRMEKDRDRLAVFFAGYDEDMKTFFESNAGLASRVTRKFYFNDYNGDELLQIFELITNKNKYQLNEAASESLKSYFDYIYYIRNNNFGNGRDVRNAFEKLIKAQADRIASIEDIEVNTLMTITNEDVHSALPLKDILIDENNLDAILDELNEYVGLDNIKEHITNLINLVKTNKKREEMGLPIKQLTFHSIFTGNPGTGKTTIARILGKLYHSLGILKKGHLIEVDRSGLIGSYIGQTEQKTNAIIDSAIDGILFIDEAYSLAGGNNDYGQKAIDTLLKRMDDDRNRLIVIVAGYTNEMNDFINTNPGLKDRFTREFIFDDFTNIELVDIFKILANKQQYIIQEDGNDRLLEYFENVLIISDNTFGNGRFVRNFFERVVMEQANRLSTINDLTKEDLRTIICDDINNATHKAT